MDPEEELEQTVSRLGGRVAELVDRLEKLSLAEYLALFDSPVRLFWMNVLAGIGRGVGAAIGFTIITAIIIYILQRIVMLNLPVISEFLVHVITLVRQRGGF